MRMIIFPFVFVDRIVNPILSKYVGLCVCVGLMGESFLSCFFFPSFSIYAFFVQEEVLNWTSKGR